MGAVFLVDDTLGPYFSGYLEFFSGKFRAYSLEEIFMGTKHAIVDHYSKSRDFPERIRGVGP